MSATMITLTWSATVEDWDHLPQDVTDEAERTGKPAFDVVGDRLSEVMNAAGQAFIDQNPDCFRGGLG